MKTLLLTCFLFAFTWFSFSQQLSKSELRMLQKYNIEVANYNNNLEAITDFKSLAKSKRRLISNTIFASYFTLSGVTYSILGVKLLGEHGDNSIGVTFGTLVTMVGLAQLGVSIPFHNGIKNNRIKRDALIEKYRQ